MLVRIDVCKKMRVYYLCFGLMAIFIMGCNTTKKTPRHSGPEKPYDPMLMVKTEMNRGNNTKALALLEDIIASDPNNAEAYMRKGSIYYENGQVDSALNIFEYVISNHPDFSPEMYYSAGIASFDLEQYVKASTYFSNYVDKSSKSNTKRDKAKSMAEVSKFRSSLGDNTYEIDPSPLKGGINSSDSEYLPRLTIDGNYMIFTRRVNGQEDLYISKKISYDTWGPAEELNNVNTLGNEGAHTISSDGKLIIFTACDRKLGIGSCDLFYTKLIGDTWTIPTVMNNNVNTAAWDSHPCLSADGSKLYFSSTREGGYGMADLYVSEKQLDGSWGKAQNLGPNINTSGRDESPFIHADGINLYFRTDGRPGMGAFDIFKSTYDINSQVWTMPVNLGPPINTEGDEGSFSVSTNGLYAYYSSDYVYTGSSPNLDLHQFLLPEHLRPIAVTYIKARVTDKNTGKVVPATVSLAAKNKKEVYREKVDQQGEFIFALPPQEDYVLTVDHPGYTYYLEMMSFPTIYDAHTPYDLDIQLTPLAVDNNDKQESEPIVLQHIYFNTGSADLLPLSNTEIVKISEMLRAQSEIKLKIIGHTDNVGNDVDNQQLSERRANAVKDALVSKGISQERIIAIGLGESQPIANNDTEDGKKLNRRTEMVIIYP